MYHLQLSDHSLRLLDSSVERFAFRALLEGIPQGHYKMPFVERLAPRTRQYGPGRLFLADLAQRDIKALEEDEWAKVTIDDRVKIADVVGSIGQLRGMEKKVSVHGGGETLSRTMALSNYQPLTSAGPGVRVHNSDLSKLIDFLQPRLFCGQLVVVTVTH